MAGQVAPAVAVTGTQPTLVGLFSGVGRTWAHRPRQRGKSSPRAASRCVRSRRGPPRGLAGQLSAQGREDLGVEEPSSIALALRATCRACSASPGLAALQGAVWALLQPPTAGFATFLLPPQRGRPSRGGPQALGLRPPCLPMTSLHVWASPSLARVRRAGGESGAKLVLLSFPCAALAARTDAHHRPRARYVQGRRWPHREMSRTRQLR